MSQTLKMLYKGLGRSESKDSNSDSLCGPLFGLPDDARLRKASDIHIAIDSAPLHGTKVYMTFVTDAASQIKPAKLLTFLS